MLNRFTEYLKSKGIKYAQAERECGLSNGIIKSALNKGSALGSDKVENILLTYPDLSAEWLLRGTGDMLLTDKVNQEQIFRAFNLPPNSDKIIEIWLQFMECTRGMQEIYKEAQQPHISHMAT